MASKLRFFPVTVFFALPGTFLITYLISALMHHVEYILPTISDTGASVPESCVFGMLLNLTVALMLFIVYVRHKQISEFFKAKSINKSKEHVAMINMIATSAGVLSCIGLDVAANFQISHLPPVHDCGILLCFWCSAIYIFIQTVISFWMSPEMTSLWVVAVRGILGMMATALIVIAITVELVAEEKLIDVYGNFNRSVIAHWNSTQPGWPEHITSGLSQWITVVTIGSFILTYYIDFKRVTIYPPELVMHADPVPKPVEATNFRSLQYIYS
ncbi:unnamed protein product [Nezara viridula]|uniref:CWH43-like N-terminal domain-containing protein n=1 Tax=Nezara viridula TaxID=85310 RepID=A0A9P0HD08_NEZVI|nr:unnamed protein product [Nezara viridula]